MVNGDCGSGLDPQVAPPPLEPTVVAGHHLTFPQHWEERGGGGKNGCITEETKGGKKKKPVIGLSVHDDGSRGRLSQQDRMRFQQALLDSSAPLKFRCYAD